MARVPSLVKLAFGKDPSGKSSYFSLVSVRNVTMFFLECRGSWKSRLALRLGLWSFNSMKIMHNAVRVGGCKHDVSF